MTARGMEARQGRDAQRLDGEATTARPEGTRPGTTAPQPVAPEGEALSPAYGVTQAQVLDLFDEWQDATCVERPEIAARLVAALLSTPPSPQAAVATAEEREYTSRTAAVFFQQVMNAKRRFDAGTYDFRACVGAIELAIAALRGEAGR